MGSGIKGTLSRFTDSTRLGGAVSSLEGRDGIQRDLDRLESWAGEPHGVNKVKCKALHLGHGNPRHTNSLGREVIGNRSVEKDLGVMVEEKLREELAACDCSPVSQLCPGLHLKDHQRLEHFPYRHRLRKL
ncbi:hypothetical protein HGM15179_012591 [Zosterops borbonicus]|uniref:Uncharacterized protein n=1 Tax=Zosterops borbonicus TaxID=364589 RepID=A0A8K1GAJ1_9PASS|nr:hypothetical protein HGM15179_012591 [Zosterops borbonicus]